MSRDGEIRTHDLSHPKRTRYQTALRPEKSKFKSRFPRLFCQTSARLISSQMLLGFLSLIGFEHFAQL